MIKNFVDIYMEHKGEMKDYFSKQHPEEYKDIVTKAVEIIAKYDKNYPTMDAENIHEINDGDYQGTLLYIIPADKYQPDHYWAVFVDYGSCSGCDTLEAIRMYDDYDQTPKKEQVDDYMMLALHIVQHIKDITNTEVGE